VLDSARATLDSASSALVRAGRTIISHAKKKPTANAMIASSHQLAANHSGVTIMSSLSECGMIGGCKSYPADVRQLTPTKHEHYKVDAAGCQAHQKTIQINGVLRIAGAAKTGWTGVVARAFVDRSRIMASMPAVERCA
jgi:hypothetical protein